MYTKDTHSDHNYDMSYNEIEIFSGNFYQLFSISIYINIFKIEDMFRKVIFILKFIIA